MYRFIYIELEGINSNLFSVDIESAGSVKRIINVYRSFNPQNNVTARIKFKYQLELIKIAMNESFVVIDDEKVCLQLKLSNIQHIHY